MQFTTPGGEAFEISTELWERAGMPNFVAERSCYHVDDERCALIPISDIVPPKRQPGIEGFGENGLNDERLESILRAIRDDAPLPPVELLEVKSGLYTYEVYHGMHRYFASVAAGFTDLPATVGPDRQQVARYLEDEESSGGQTVRLPPPSE